MLTRLKCNEIIRAVFNFRMLAAVTIVLVIWNNEIIINQGFFQYYWPKTEADVTTFWADIIACSGFSPISAALPGIPFAFSLLEERNSGFLRMELSRRGSLFFAIRRILAILVSGILVMLIPFCVEQILFSMVCSPTTIQNHEQAYDSLMWRNVMFIGGGKLYVIMQGALFGLYGALWAAFDALLSLFTRNRYLALIVPFAIDQLIWNLGIWQLNTEFLWRGDPHGESLLYPYIVYLVLIIIVCFVLVYSFMMQIRKGKF